MAKESIENYITLLDDLARLCASGKLGDLSKMYHDTLNCVKI